MHQLKRPIWFQISLAFSTVITLLSLGTLPAISSQGGVTFIDIAANDGAGITYRRTASVSDQELEQFKADSLINPVSLESFAAMPIKSRGAPGVAILDYDDDGDQDIYVTNGPGTANSLYANQLQQAGNLTFVDVGTSAGVAATAQDSTGVCYGDTDNDGDHDLFVLGNLEPNKLFINQGNGSFADGTAASGLGNDSTSSLACSMGDINGDGLLDIAIANLFDMRDQFAIFVDYFAFNEPNQLFLNQGNNTFLDISASSGFLELDLPDHPDVPEDPATITWAIAMVDYDLDGDLDIFQADDQAALPNTAQGGLDRSYIQIFQNDGSGNFTNVTYESAMGREGGWMGLTYGDFDHNGFLDVFASNFGNHTDAILEGGQRPPNEESDSRWFLQQPGNIFLDIVLDVPPFTSLNTPFGWGTSAADYDNDGDTDLIMHGGLDLGPLIATSPGTILRNDGQANFSRDTTALANSTDHVRRNVHGVAIGDLNNDGFIDIVSVSNFDMPDPIPLVPGPQLGGEFDVDNAFVPTFAPTNDEPPLFQFTGLTYPDGTLSVEINSADNNNRWVQIETLGTIGITSNGQVNRDGIGAVIFFTPKHGNTVMQPILGGSSYASQDSLAANFGLGGANKGTVEVLWPGGVRNRLYNVHQGDQILFPEIPCSFDGDWPSKQAYQTCVQSALDELVAANILSQGDTGKFLSSALKAFNNQ